MNNNKLPKSFFFLLCVYQQVYTQPHLNLIGWLTSEGSVKDNNGFSGNGFVSEYETSSILTHAMFQVLPVSEGMDSFIETDFLQNVTR